MLLKNFLEDELQVKKGSVKMPIKGLIEQYQERYEEMSQDTTRPFRHMAYRVSPGGKLIVHVKIPSRSLPKFYYDVLLELDPPAGATTLGDCHFRIFSNSPSFVYTYAYVFYHLDIGDSGNDERQKKRSRTGMIIDSFTNKLPRERLMIAGAEDKLGKQALKEEPVTRNPLGLPYLDSSIYLAIFYLNDVTTLEELKGAKNYRTMKQILDSVDDFNHLMATRDREVKKQQREKAKQREKEAKKVKAAPVIVKQGSNIQVMAKPMTPKSVSGGSSLKKPATNRGKNRGVHRIG